MGSNHFIDPGMKSQLLAAELETHMMVITSGQKVNTERKDAAGPEAFFGSLLLHLIRVQ
jgi:hypothetical protein